MYYHLKSLQQKHRESRKHNKFEREVEVVFSDDEEDEQSHENDEYEEAMVEKADDVYNFEGLRDKLLKIPTSCNSKNQVPATKIHNWDEQDDYSEKSNRDTGVRNGDLKNSGVTSPNSIEDYRNTPSTPLHNTESKGKEVELEEQSSPSSPVASSYIMCNSTIARDPGNVKARLTNRTPDLLSRSNSNIQPVSTSKSLSRTITISSPSLTNLPKKSLSSRPRLKSYMDTNPGFPNAPEHVFFSDLPSIGNPVQGLTKGLNDLSSTDWEINVEGFRILVAILRHDPKYMQPDLHNVNMAGIKHIGNLRSQVCRAACLFFQEMFCQLGKLMEPDVEKIGEKLLDKSADTNKFIRDSSCAALEAMVENLSPTKTIIPLENFGAKHRNSAVKSTTAKLFTVVIRKLGPEKCLTQMGKRVLLMLVQFLQEGSQETRTHAKAGMSLLMSHGYFETSLRNNVPPDTLRNVIKTIDGIKKELLQKKHPSQTVRW